MPLTNLTKKNHHFVWTEDRQTAFDTLKQALLSPPILTLPNDTDTFILDTEAAEGSIGCSISAAGWTRKSRRLRWKNAQPQRAKQLRHQEGALGHRAFHQALSSVPSGTSVHHQDRSCGTVVRGYGKRRSQSARMQDGWNCWECTTSPSSTKLESLTVT